MTKLRPLLLPLCLVACAPAATTNEQDVIRNGINAETAVDDDAVDRADHLDEAAGEALDEANMTDGASAAALRARADADLKAAAAIRAQGERQGEAAEDGIEAKAGLINAN